jgi:hypothetical protein
MESLNTVMEKMSPIIISLFQLLIICVESFFANVYVAGKCIYVYFSSESYSNIFEDFSIKKYNKIINDEIQKQNNLLVTNIGVWISMFFCINVLWTMLENLMFPVIFLIGQWIFLWILVFSLKEKFGFLFQKLKKA